MTDTCGDEDSEDHDCCDNEYTSVDTDDNFAKASFDIAIVFPLILNVGTPIDSLEFEPFNSLLVSYIDYNPPPLIKDIPVLYETFLI